MEESSIIAAAATGDPEAERALFEAHVDRIYRLAYRMTRDEALAEDYTQDTFVRAFAKLSGFEGRAAFSTWLHSIAVSVVLNGLRKVKRFRRREVGLDQVAEAAARIDNPDLELRMVLDRAIDLLPDELRLIFVMHDVEGYKHREIAEALDVPVGTTKTRLSRARAELKLGLTRSGISLAREEGS